MPPAEMAPALPELSSAMLSFFRSSYGFLMVLQLLASWPMIQWFFTSERWGGYAKSSPAVDALHNPMARPIIRILWMTCALLLVLGRWTLWAGAINLLLCWYFHIFMRWRGILRGMGAPGFMSFWGGAAVFFLDLAAAVSGLHSTLFSIVLLAFQVDFAVIMLCAGTYKFLAGYPKNHGMQLGMANPYWGYWWQFYKRLPYYHGLYKFLNQCAWGTEIVAGILMLVPHPTTRFLGALLIMSSFVFISMNIRLTFLAEVVIVCGLIFFPPGGIGERWLISLFGSGHPPPVWLDAPAYVSWLMGGFFLLYLAMLPFAKFGLYYNFLARRSLPGVLQKILVAWTNAFGIIIWRVFSVDVVNFFVRVKLRHRETGAEREYTRLGELDWGTRFRYVHVGEFICLASIFTTLKYFTDNPDLFKERLFRYVRTVPYTSEELVRFEVQWIVPGDNDFKFVHAADYIVDPVANTLEEHIYDSTVPLKSGHSASPVHQGSTPGSYAPK